LKPVNGGGRVHRVTGFFCHQTNLKGARQMEEKIKDSGFMKRKWTIRRYAYDDAFKRDQPYDVSSFEGNLLLNEGMTEALNLIGGITADAYSNTNARIGVGDDDTAAAAGQTGLQAVTNKTWKAMEATYPQVSDQTITFRSVFGSSDANYAWKEFTVVNTADDTGDNLNRKVSDQGTKVSGQTWTVDLEITLS
jgi:hypothetical protein